MEINYKAKAGAIWLQLNESEKTGIRFGLFPLKFMKEAEIEGYKGKELCVALMEVAEKKGGMIA